MNDDATRTDHQALTAARRAAQDEENRRAEIAVRYAERLAPMIHEPRAFTYSELPTIDKRGIVRVYPEYVEPAPVSYDWRTNVEA
jgi:hypothetical protein